MAQVYVSIGSNLEPLRHIRRGLQELQRHYGPLSSSSTYESKAIGFVGDNFYNLVVGFATTQEPISVIMTLQMIEQTQGRKRPAKILASRTLDLDLLLYDDLVIEELSIPREDILQYAFVLRPLAEIAPNQKHPTQAQSYAQLWAAFSHKNSQPLWKVEA